MIDARLGEILSTLDFPMTGTWRQVAEDPAELRTLPLKDLTLELAQPGVDVLEQADQALTLSLPELDRLVAAAGTLGHLDLAAPGTMVEAMRQAAGAHFAEIYVELEWDAQGWSLHQAKQVVAGQADSPALDQLNPETQIPLFAARAAFGPEVQTGEWLGFALDGESSLVLRLLWESAAP